MFGDKALETGMDTNILFYFTSIILMIIQACSDPKVIKIDDQQENQDIVMNNPAISQQDSSPIERSPLVVDASSRSPQSVEPVPVSQSDSIDENSMLLLPGNEINTEDPVKPEDPAADLFEDKWNPLTDEMNVEPAMAPYVHPEYVVEQIWQPGDIDTGKVLDLGIKSDRCYYQGSGLIHRDEMLFVHNNSENGGWFRIFVVVEGYAKLIYDTGSLDENESRLVGFVRDSPPNKNGEMIWHFRLVCSSDSQRYINSDYIDELK